MDSSHFSEDKKKISIKLHADMPRSQIDDTIAQLKASLGNKEQVNISVRHSVEKKSWKNSAKILRSILTELKNYPDLTTLKIKNSVISQECFQKIQSLKNLTHLSFKTSSLYECEDYEPLTKLQGLSELDLSVTNFFAEDFESLQLKGIQKTKFLKFLEAIKTLTKLNNLNLGFNTLVPHLKKKNNKKYNKWAIEIIELSVESLIDCFKGDTLDLSGCNLGICFLNSYQKHIQKAKRLPTEVDLTYNSFISDEVANFIFYSQKLPQKILFDKPEEIKREIANIILEEKNVTIGN